MASKKLTTCMLDVLANLLIESQACLGFGFREIDQCYPRHYLIRPLQRKANQQTLNGLIERGYLLRENNQELGGDCYRWTTIQKRNAASALLTTLYPACRSFSGIDKQINNN